MNIAPDTNLLKALRYQMSLRWPVLTGELIDNAADANARFVEISFTNQPDPRVIVSDNGFGCNDLHKMLSAGSRADHRTTRSGRFGIGGKEAFIVLGDKVLIESVCPSEGILRTAQVDWREVQTSGSWNIPDPTATPTTRPHGTKIIISKLVRKFPSDWGELKATLGKTYASALSSGHLVLSVRTPGSKQAEIIEPLGQPSLAQIEEADIPLASGKSIFVRMGMIVSRDQLLWQGVTLAIKGGRVIRSRTRIGLGSDPTPGLFAWVELVEAFGSRFKMSKNKDDISGEDEQQIAQAIALRFQYLIAHARKAGEDIDLADQNSSLARLGEIVRHDNAPPNRKAKRASPVNHTGTVLPANSGRTHKQAARSQPGNRFNETRIGNSRLRLQRQARGNTDIFSLEDDGTIYVNTDHGFYAYCKGDMELLTPMAVMFFVSHSLIRGDGQRVLPFPETQADDATKHAERISYLLNCYTQARAAQTCEVVPA